MRRPCPPGRAGEGSRPRCRHGHLRVGVLVKIAHEHVEEAQHAKKARTHGSPHRAHVVAIARACVFAEERQADDGPQGLQRRRHQRPKAKGAEGGGEGAARGARGGAARHVGRQKVPARDRAGDGGVQYGLDELRRPEQRHSK
eukprot:scaffold2565_cov58-Phaeocystis_antarctica.AAC.2